ncbi:hypothetical protein [Psychromonas sp.]|uniref:hypothetical protein n=1 Tax=Psychromonas sp. TaxID=1884585 RepID=UPI003A9699FE
MQYLNRILLLCRQHQTRQQLRNIPRLILKDIGKTQYQVDKELTKSSAKNIIYKGVSHLYQFIVGRG